MVGNNSAFEPDCVEIAVAFIEIEPRRVVLAWSENWESFVFPMTKLGSDTPERAAVRAAAEVFQLPCRAAAGEREQVKRSLQLSGSDGKLKDYHFSIVSVEVHPDFQRVALNRPSVVVADYDKLRAGEYQPLSPTVKMMLESTIQWG